MRINARYLYFALILIIGYSCKQESDSAPRRIKHNALGVMNDIVVVADQDVWDGIVGDSIRHYFEGYFPLTPRPEPIFDLRHFTYDDVISSNAKKELRTYLIVADLDDPSSDVTKLVTEDLGSERLSRNTIDKSFTTSIGRDKWANGQVLIYLFDRGLDDLADAVVTNYNGISSKVNEHDLVQLDQQTYARGRNGGLNRDFKTRYNGIDIEIPTDFKTVQDSLAYQGFFWMRKDDKHGAVNMALRMYDYSGPDMITKAAAKDRFNLFARKISSEAQGSYGVINDVDLPILEYDRSINNHFTREWRGIWEMEQDFMGGPFISYAIINESKQKMLVVDAIFFAPGVKKRGLMQQIDHIVKSIEWAD